MLYIPLHTLLLTLTVELINVKYYDPIHGELHVEVSQAYGGGDSFHVTINGYYHGKVVHYPVGWVSYIKLEILTRDDIDAIMDAVERLDM